MICEMKTGSVLVNADRAERNPGFMENRQCAPQTEAPEFRGISADVCDGGETWRAGFVVGGVSATPTHAQGARINGPSSSVKSWGTDHRYLGIYGLVLEGD